MFDGHAALGAHEALDPALSAILELVHAGIELGLHGRRHPKLKRVADKRPVEPFRHHADDRERQAVERLRLPNDRRIAAKTVLPHLIADHDDRMCIASGVFTRLEPAPEHGMHADRIEIVGRDHAAGHALGAVTDAERRAGDFLGDERFDQRAVARQVLKVRPGHFDQRAAGTAVGARHGEEPILIHDERERSQEDAFDPAEDRRVGTDAERQAQDRQQGKARTASQHAEAVPKILNHRVCLGSSTLHRLEDTGERPVDVMQDGDSRRPRLSLANG